VKGKQDSSFDEERALGEILNALEYGTKKQENDSVIPLANAIIVNGRRSRGRSTQRALVSQS
jgi:hypothetical protein